MLKVNTEAPNNIFNQNMPQGRSPLYHIFRLICNKEWYKLFSLLGIMLLFSYCKKENMFDYVKISGPIVTKVREVPQFNSIHISHKIDLFLTQGPNFEVKVEAGKNFQKNIKTEVRDSVLYISNENKGTSMKNPKKKIKVYITMPKLKLIESRGVGITTFMNRFVQDTLSLRVFLSGDIHANMDVNVFQTVSHGNGDVYAEGFANRCSNYTNGTNFIHEENLTVKDYVYVESFSVGHCFINAPVNGPIEGKIWSSGNVYYRGTPTEINFTSNSSGNLIKQ